MKDEIADLADRLRAKQRRGEEPGIEFEIDFASLTDERDAFMALPRQRIAHEEERVEARREPPCLACAPRPGGPQAGLMHVRKRRPFELPGSDGWRIGLQPIVSPPCRCEWPAWWRFVGFAVLAILDASLERTADRPSPPGMTAPE